MMCTWFYCWGRLEENVIKILIACVGERFLPIGLFYFLDGLVPCGSIVGKVWDLRNKGRELGWLGLPFLFATWEDASG